MRRCLRDNAWALSSDYRVRSSAEALTKDLYGVLHHKGHDPAEPNPDKKPTPQRSDVRVLSSMCFKFWCRVCFLFPVQSHGWDFRIGVSSDHSASALHSPEPRARPRLRLLASPQLRSRSGCGCASLLTLVTSAPRISFFVSFLGPVLIGFGSLDSSALENNYAVSRERIVARPV